MRLLARARPIAAALALLPFGISTGLSAAPPARAATSRTLPRQTIALSPFERAERMHEALEGRPEEQRTRRDYVRVLEAFRAIYHGDPASSRADASISMVADLLAEEGRVFQDERPLHAAVGQYEFLRREYPGSRFRFSALLTEAEIFRHDLNDRPAAKALFQQFLQLYPQNMLADQARQGLKQIHAEEVAEKRTGRRAAEMARAQGGAISAQDAAVESGAPAATSTQRPAGPRRSRNTVLTAAVQSRNPQPPASPPSPRSEVQPHTNAAANQPAPAPQKSGTVEPAAQTATAPALTNPAAQQTSPVAPPDETQTASVRDADLNSTPPPARRGRMPLVTGVRHWSTAVYTRVAIDLQGQVEYEAARVPNPDRIFFDLHGARLSPELIGRSVVVTDDGFLKRIRAAQFSNEVTRIVLDVSDVSDYSAFLLPNPYRLIIDIHGRKGGSANETAQASPPAQSTLPDAGIVGDPPPAPRSVPRPTKPATQAQAPPASNSAGQQTSSLPPMAPAPPPAGRQPVPPNQNPRSYDRQTPQPQSANDRTTEVRPAETRTSDAQAGNTGAPAGSTIQDIANLGHQANRVKATRGPTTAPISASVAGTTPAPQPSNSSIPATRSAPPSSHRSAETPGAETAAGGIHEAGPTAAGGRSLSRALGLKIGRIVVDAGHGGHDSGTLGPDGVEEKEIVLDVALRLGKLLKKNLGADVIFTRDDDTFIPLETRTAIANKAQADLFISVHANSSQDPSARGVETYYLNFTSSADALEVAARENAVSQQSVHQLSDLVKKIALQDKIDESREFAADVQKNLFDGLVKGNPGLRDRGVKKAPFVVLIGANMPSILAEISFLTNPDDAQELHEPAYRQRIAESLYHGVARYVSGLSGVRLAESSPHTAGN